MHASLLFCKETNFIICPCYLDSRELFEHLQYLTSLVNVLVHAYGGHRLSKHALFHILNYGSFGHIVLPAFHPQCSVSLTFSIPY